MFDGFTKHGNPSYCRGRLDERVDVVTVAEREVLRDREPGARERALHHDLVHADRGAEHARADVRQVGELEETLHRAVFAVRAVQQREHDVDAERRSGHRRDATTTSPPPGSVGGRTASPSTANAAGSASRPASSIACASAASSQRTVGRDADGHDLVALGIERLGDRDRRHARHVVLRRPAAEQEHDAQPAR